MRHFVSRRVEGIKPSAIRRFFDILNTMHDVISLGIGEPDFATPEHICQAAMDSLSQGQTQYSSNAGAIELRTLLADKLAELYGVRYDPQTELVITVGASEAIAAAMTAVVDHGDEIIVAQPCFVSYVPEVLISDGIPVIVDARAENNFAITAQDIQAKITPQTKAIFLSYPNNPTGAVVPRAEMLQIAALAQQHDLLMISDEAYDRLVYGVEHVCVAALPGMRERTLFIGGFSKAYAMTGWRIGFIAGPAEIIAAVSKVHQYDIMCAPTMAQYAAIRALEHGEPDVQRMVAEYDRRRRFTHQGLNAIGLPTFEPQGAFYCFPRVDHLGISDAEFCERLLLEEKVAIVPGSGFGASGAGYVRVCYASSMENLEQALIRMGRFVEKYGK